MKYVPNLKTKYNGRTLHTMGLDADAGQFDDIDDME